MLRSFAASPRSTTFWITAVSLLPGGWVDHRIAEGICNPKSAIQGGLGRNCDPPPSGLFLLVV
eukprot:5336155-Prorocentrum_lima.AAC.1